MKFWRLSFASLLAFSLSAALQAADIAQPLNGKWVVTDLVEDGNVVPKAAIPEWLPSGGKLEIEDGAILFTSHVDHQKHARLFKIDGTRVPNVITITDPKKTQVKGIVKTEGDSLVVCLSAPGDQTPPTDFSAEPGSKRMLMVLKRVAPPAEKTVEVQPTPAIPRNQVAAEVLTDDQVRKMLVGTWQFNDAHGSLITTFNADGTYSTTRSVEKMKIFKIVFIETPISSGTWKVDEDHLFLHVLSTIHPEKLGQTYSYTIRSISATDFIFTDFFGRVDQARRLKVVP